MTVYDSNRVSKGVLYCNGDITTGKYLTAGTYYIEVYNAAYAKDINYTISASLVSPTIIETPINNNFSTGYEKDYYKYVVSEDGYYTFTYDETEIGSNVAAIIVYDSNNSSKAGISSPDDMTTGAYLSAGTYYVEVYNYSSSAISANYTISASFAPTISETPTTNNFSAGYETDYYKYVVSEDGYYTFTYDETEIGSKGASITVYDSNYSSKTSSSSSSDITTGVYLSAGTYYVEVYNNSSSVISANYTLSAKQITFNDNTPTITSISTGNIAENAVTSTVIYKVEATDADANTTLAYSLSGTDAAFA